MYPPQRSPQTVQFDVPQQPPTILRRPPPPPRSMAAAPPVPEQPEERGVNIIKLEEPGELNIMPVIKRTRVQERDEEMKSDTSEEPKKGKKKAKEDEAESSKKKKSRQPRWVIGIDDFLLGKNLEPYDMVEDLKSQRPNITWPQLMHLSSSIRRQWPKLASTRIPKKRKEKVVKSIKSNTPKDIEPIVDAYIKGKRVSNVYVDGGAQVCVITERTMHRLGLSIIEPSDCHAKLANNSKVKGLGIIKDVHITVLDVSAKVDFYVVPSKGEGYPLILGRPWLMEVNADQKWGSGKLVLQKGKRIVYDMKLGKQSNIWFETSTDEDSSDESSYGDEESYTSDESSMEVMGLVFQQPQAKGSSTEVEVTAQEEPMLEKRFRNMLAKDLTKEKEEDYINTFKRYPHLFITDYSMIKGVDVIQHHIDLKKRLHQHVQEISTDRALHCQRVEEGLQRLYQYGGQLNPDKCHVAEKEVVLLGHVISQEGIKVDPFLCSSHFGHVISQEGIKVDPSRVQAILDLPPPNSARQVITFVQKVRYMSCFIHLLSQIISPLQKLENQEVFSWEQEHLECFNEVQEVLGSLPTIMPPNPQRTYYLCPSVGLDAFGAVLMQKDPKTAYMRPIYFTSKVMTQRQKGYTDIEQLVFSLIVAMRKFRSYLLPKLFISFTLEHNLPYAIQHMSISSKISKWVLELQEYEYTFIVEDSTRASLVDVLTYKVKEKKITPKAQVLFSVTGFGFDLVNWFRISGLRQLDCLLVLVSQFWTLVSLLVLVSQLSVLDSGQLTGSG
ncbi:hypothetical protein L7F22_022494 [Adiantum nelumboides]|nr:hypothetical protein [Adiantum nelumboides]